MRNNVTHEVVIVGAGPAGVAAAVQLARSGIRPVVVEKSVVGGAIREANFVENYPGFPEGIRGDEIARLLERHLGVHGIQSVREEVTVVTRSETCYQVRTAGGLYEARHVIIASGAKPKPLPDDVPLNLLSKGTHYSLDSLRETEPKTVAIIGAGDISFDYAQSCSSFAERVLLLGRSSKPRCLRVLEMRAHKNPKIEVLPGHPVTGVSEEDNGLVIQCRDQVVTADEILVAVGRVANAAFLDPELAGSCVTGRLDAGNGLFFAGDVIRGDLRQVAIAAGDGLRCALTICKSF
jgi:thioredoxin reductase